MCKILFKLQVTLCPNSEGEGDELERKEPVTSLYAPGLSGSGGQCFETAREELLKELPACPNLDQAGHNGPCMEAYSETVSETSGIRLQDGCLLRRAHCRFTQSGAAWFCGIESGYLNLNYDCSMLEVYGRLDRRDRYDLNHA